ncbi:MAG: hypothetical protein ACXVCY_16600 [Pseudobdellovibrionaceae bacterium]
MNLKIALLAVTTLAFNLHAKAETFCTENQKSVLSIVDGKGSLIQTDIATNATQVINMTSVKTSGLPSESSDDSIWGQAVTKTESVFFQGIMSGTNEPQEGGLIKFYLKNDDVALVFVKGELNYVNLGTQKSCK